MVLGIGMSKRRWALSASVALADKNVRARADLVQHAQTRRAGGADDAARLNRRSGATKPAQAERDQVRGDLADAEARYPTIVGQAPGVLQDSGVPASMLPTDLEPPGRSRGAGRHRRRAELDAGQSGAASRFGGVQPELPGVLFD